MKAKKTWMALTLAAGMTLGACGSVDAAATAKTESGVHSSAGGSTTRVTSSDGLAALDALRKVSEKSVPSGDVYAGTVKASNASAESMMAQNQRPHADSNDAEYEEASATKISLNGTTATIDGNGASADSGKVTISKEGTYVLSGDFTGQVVVDAPDTAKVKVVLKGANIESSTDAAIRVVQAEEAVIALAEGTTNSVSDTSKYASNVDGPTAAIASKADLTIGGSGTLNVKGNGNDGISSADGLVVTGGTITVTAADDAIRGKDYVVVAAGTLDLKAGGDAIKSDNETDAGRGYVLLTGGTVSGSATSDAIDATSDLIVTGGKVTVTKAEEGFEAATVLLAGGSANVTSTDDGLNATGGSSPWLAVTGGDWVLNSNGDGFDSNGEGVISGGTMTVYGPTNAGNGAVDVQNGMKQSGGTLIAVGSAGMDEAPEMTGEQSAIKAQAKVSAGATVSILDSSGKQIASYTSPKAAGSVVFSSPDVKKGQTYTVAVNGQSAATAKGGDYQAGSLGPGSGGAFRGGR